MKEFKADFGFDKPLKTVAECQNPEFADKHLHRLAIMKDFHVGNKGDIDQNGISGWISKKVCTGCGRVFTKNHSSFYQD